MSENKTDENNVLRLTDITMQFGGVVAINNLSLDVNRGEIVALIGPNGAGKTTAFNCVTGVYEPTNGAVYFHGKPIAVNHPRGKMVKQYAGINADRYLEQKTVSYTPDKITHLGIARTFQNIRLFKSQTAFENVLIGTHLRRTSNFLTATFRLNAREERENREKAMNLLEEVGLTDVADELATSLPYGKQRRLEIARALATDPTLLLLDEPAAGMNPQETDELGEFIVDIKNKFDLTVFMIEHHMNLVMDISDRIYVLDFGRQIAEGTPEEIQKNPVVIAAYLGVDEE
jgi:amino acid/amide ABC transporter ATP-binding protein 1, HAAT family (TC 3.A.1.4.-)